ncbi:MAG: hypothetical protein C0505_06320 [Leptothrix sp. (in: Bacteria)]|nr:hypothetical protein [Leptothrix sp. (in: b-proteobacteria)]
MACGAALAEGDTVPATLPGAHRDTPVDDFQASALWFDELGQAPAAPRAMPDRQAALPDVSVREILLPSPFGHSTAQAPPAPPTSPGAAAPASNPFAADRAGRAAIKSARRAAVRQARLAATLPLVVSDILVVEADADARHHLDELLSAFGFRVRPVASLAQGALLAAHHPFAAAFVAVPPGAIDGAVHDLFESARDTGRRAGIAATVRVLVSAMWRPVDRVRAELAGCDGTLAKPVIGRDLARVLDTHGVKLPQDPRRR